MSKILTHIHSGPKSKNKRTLGLLVTVTSAKQVHDVSLFLATDTVHALNCKSREEIVGQGTGDVKVHLDAIKDTEIKIWVSGMSAKARGYDDALLNGFDAEFSMPDKLINLSIEADSVLCY